ncbi:hypothetical protein [Methylomicrobium agile]|uniref:hypothetical protein n=1 Tax=Methylomicrobium agile TaxID=39774 RepID=UPI00069169C5|nr:hypothetical protein [Methylomicrobium agile]
MRRLIFSVCFAALTGCVDPVIQKEFVTVELSRPARPVLPRVSGKELACLTQDAYQRLYDRQRAITDYAATLEAIIDSTHQPPGGSNQHEEK